MPAPRFFALALVVMWVCRAVPASGFGVRYPGPVVEATGSGVDLVPRLTGASPRWTVEAADCVRFAGTGLRESGLRVQLARGGWRGSALVAVLQAGPGHETRLAARMGRDGAWTLVIAVVHDVAQVGGFDAARRTTVGLETGVRLRDGVDLRCDIGGFGVAGVRDPGVDIATGVTAVAPDGVAVAGTLLMDRRAGAHVRVSAAVRLPGELVVVGGYDDESTMFSLALAVNAGALRAGAGASMHPVLGTSRAVSVGWSR